MPCVNVGGLFIPSNSNYRLGDEVFMLLNLMGEDEELPVARHVIWVTPRGALRRQACPQDVVAPRRCHAPTKRLR
jgi:type IV pilus assembly protein PilZ